MRPDLEAIKARCEAATAGPWRTGACSHGGAILLRGTLKHGDHPQSHLQVVPTSDADLIANARTDVPDLLAYIAELEADLKAVVEALDRCEGNRGRFSCTPAHDCRCDKDRKISDECTCGADDLTAAIARPGVQARLK